MIVQRRKLPIGVQTFSEIIREDYYYVDKTSFAYKMIDEGKCYFLSRPQGFGKSLLLDTLKELYEGNEALFQGLYIHNKWDWQRRHPVVRISFGTGGLRNREELDRRIGEMLNEQALALGVTFTHKSIEGRFSELLTKAAQQHGVRTVLLIDEYDKPILDNINDASVAIEMREGVKNLYSAIKDCDASIEFCLLTGVSRFSKVSLFSGLNNLRDITLSREYSAICGYTDADVDQVFAPELSGFNRDELRQWYNGYNWLGESVYNPFDLLLLFREQVFSPYWFETVTPTFLVKLLAQRGVATPQLSKMQSKASLISRFDVDDIGTEALLFQAGYLTIHHAEQRILGKWTYTLGYPNHEVQASLNEALLPVLGIPERAAQAADAGILTALQEADFTAFESHFKALFASIPYNWYTNNPIAQYEGYYASVFYSHLAAMGLTLIAEDVSNTGRVDLTIDFEGRVFVIEFKLVDGKPLGQAMDQLREKGYAGKYRTSGKPIFLVGIEFPKQDRQIVGFEWEKDVG